MRAKPYVAGPELDTAYRGTREEWAGLLGSSQAQLRTYRRLMMAMVVVIGLALGGMYSIAKRPVLVYGLESDAVGQVTLRGPFKREFKPADANLRFHLKRFVEMVRRVSADPEFIQQSREESYWYATKRAQKVLTDYYTSIGTPAALVRAGTKSVLVTSVLKVTEGTWQVDWNERQRDHRGELGAESFHRVSLRVLLHPPEDADQLEKNPLGVYVDELNWIELRAPRR